MVDQLAMNRPAVGIGVFVYNDQGQFLMGKRVGKHGKNTWSVPGGYQEYGESFEETARREVKEETGIEIEDVEFFAITNNIFKDEQKHTITIFFKSIYKNGNPSVPEPDKFVDVGWFSFGNLPSPLFLPVQELQRLQPELFHHS